MKTIGVFKDFSDGSIKTVLKARNKGVIEVMLLFNKPDVDVIYVPTHHFCNLGCKMCHLTNEGLNKQMIPIQSDDMVEAIIKAVCYQVSDDFISDELIERRTKKRKLLISFMGVGEPLLNLALLEGLFAEESYLKEILKYSDIGYSLATMMPDSITWVWQF